MKYNSTDGNDNFTLIGAPETIDAGTGNDTFIINSRTIGGFTIDGGTNALGTDAIVQPVYYLGTSVSTVKSTLGTANATDSIHINKTGIFSALQFLHIEHIHLAEGVTAVFTSTQLTDNIASLDANAVNPGLHFYGVAGGATEKVNVIVDYDAMTFTPATTVIGASAVTYNRGDFQLDDASVGDLFHDVAHHDNFFVKSSLGSYARADGSNNDDSGVGSRGSDYATLRLGNDSYWGGTGNDLLVGGQGADWLSGGAGNDIFTITSFGGALGASGKADDGNPEWVAGDVIIGGSGTDTLRITGGAASATTVALTDSNFKNMEVVQVGSIVGRLNVEDSALQLLNNHYYQDTAGAIVGKDLRLGQTADNVSIDASGVSVKGLTFIGNANNNIFIGTSKADNFIGNGGNDTLTGGAGADHFEFGQVHSQTVSGDATSVQSYKDVVSQLTGVDTITDFVSGIDKIVLHSDMFSVFSGNTLSFDSTTQTLSYDADGAGSGAAVAIVVLTGVTAVSATDFAVI